LRHRNADWAERAVREAVSLPYDEALKANVIDLVAGNPDELLAKVNGRRVSVLVADRILDTGSATVVALEPDWRTRLLATLTDPSVAYLLLLIGLYGLIFEFSHPGIFAQGVIGTISLVLGLLALSVIPIDLAGLHNPNTAHHCVLVNVQSRTAPIKHFHLPLHHPRCRRGSPVEEI